MKTGSMADGLSPKWDEHEPNLLGCIFFVAKFLTSLYKKLIRYMMIWCIHPWKSVFNHWLIGALDLFWSWTFQLWIPRILNHKPTKHQLTMVDNFNLEIDILKSGMKSNIESTSALLRSRRRRWMCHFSKSNWPIKLMVTFYHVYQSARSHQRVFECL